MWIAVDGEVDIAENAVSVNGKIVVGTPKMHERRTVVYPEFLDEPVEAACKGKKRDALLWGDGLDHLRPGNALSGWFASPLDGRRQKTLSFRVCPPRSAAHGGVAGIQCRRQHQSATTNARPCLRRDDA
jgi:hypothetical protein